MAIKTFYYKKIKRVKLKDGKCSCGKSYPRWVDYFKRKDIDEETGEIGVKEIAKMVGYPQNSCHCNCGVKWGKHFKAKIKR